MSFVPTSIIGIWLSGLFSSAVLAGGIVSLVQWYDRSRTAAGIDFDREPALLAVGVALIVWSLAGGLFVRLVGMILSRARHGKERKLNDADREKPGSLRGGTVSTLRRPDGSELHVETFGPERGIPIVLTHGWGLNGSIWYYINKQLADTFRLIVWDLPGLGRSTRPKNRNYRLENLAADLDAVVQLAGDRPVILAGHSIGGMITLTYCKEYPQKLGKEVSGIALIHTTPTKPTRTTLLARLSQALEKPIMIPLQYLTIVLSPLVWLMNLLSYLNGTAHVMTALTGFGGTQSWNQVEFITRFQLKASPAVLARGMLAMLKYDATDVLPDISIPALVVPGDKDPVCKPEASDRMEAALPHPEKDLLSPAKHMGYVEHNRKFSELLGDFARMCQPPVI